MNKSSAFFSGILLASAMAVISGCNKVDNITTKEFIDFDVNGKHYHLTTVYGDKMPNDPNKLFNISGSETDVNHGHLDISFNKEKTGVTQSIVDTDPASGNATFYDDNGKLYTLHYASVILDDFSESVPGLIAKGSFRATMKNIIPTMAHDTLRITNGSFHLNNF